jgi:hypothetical protein
MPDEPTLGAQTIIKPRPPTTCTALAQSLNDLSLNDLSLNDLRARRARTAGHAPSRAGARGATLRNQGPISGRGDDVAR